MPEIIGRVLDGLQGRIIFDEDVDLALTRLDFLLDLLEHVDPADTRKVRVKFLSGRLSTSTSTHLESSRLISTHLNSRSLLTSSSSQLNSAPKAQRTHFNSAHLTSTPLSHLTSTTSSAQLVGSPSPIFSSPSHSRPGAGPEGARGCGHPGPGPV